MLATILMFYELWIKKEKNGKFLKEENEEKMIMEESTQRIEGSSGFDSIVKAAIKSGKLAEDYGVAFIEQHRSEIKIETLMAKNKELMGRKSPLELVIDLLTMGFSAFFGIFIATFNLFGLAAFALLLVIRAILGFKYGK